MGMVSIRLTDEDEYDLKAYNEYLENKEYQSARPLSYLIKKFGFED